LLHSLYYCPENVESKFSYHNLSHLSIIFSDVLIDLSNSNTNELNLNSLTSESIEILITNYEKIFVYTDSELDNTPTEIDLKNLIPKVETDKNQTSLEKNNTPPPEIELKNQTPIIENNTTPEIEIKNQTPKVENNTTPEIEIKTQIPKVENNTSEIKKKTSKTLK